MGEMKPIMRPSEVRKIVKEFVEMGVDVDWDTATGLVKIRGRSQPEQRDSFDMVDMRR